MPNLLKERRSYKPYEYPQAAQYWLGQMQGPWLHTNIQMSSTIEDWHNKMSSDEKEIIGGLLKGFTQTECVIGEYWSTRVCSWFPKPEIQEMARAFACYESTHAKAYNYLSETLGLEDFDVFLQDPIAAEKLNFLIDTPSTSLSDIAVSLAIFSAFAEGVSLFSSFATLMHFSRSNRLKGVADIISYSIADESQHSDAGCWLFATLIEENPSLWTSSLQDKIQEGAQLTVNLEHAFIDNIFKGKKVDGLNPEDLKAFIVERANTKLKDLGLEGRIKNTTEGKAVNITEWFDNSCGLEHADFFARRSTNYNQGVFNTDLINWDIAVA